MGPNIKWIPKNNAPKRVLKVCSIDPNDGSYRPVMQSLYSALDGIYYLRYELGMVTTPEVGYIIVCSGPEQARNWIDLGLKRRVALECEPIGKVGMTNKLMDILRPELFREFWENRLEEKHMPYVFNMYEQLVVEAIKPIRVVNLSVNLSKI